MVCKVGLKFIEEQWDEKKTLFNDGSHLYSAGREGKG